MICNWLKWKHNKQFVETISTPAPKPTKHVLKMIENVEEFLRALKKYGVKKAFSPRMKEKKNWLIDWYGLIEKEEMMNKLKVNYKQPKQTNKQNKTNKQIILLNQKMIKNYWMFIWSLPISRDHSNEKEHKQRLNQLHQVLEMEVIHLLQPLKLQQHNTFKLHLLL